MKAFLILYDKKPNNDQMKELHQILIQQGSPYYVRKKLKWTNAFHFIGNPLSLNNFKRKYNITLDKTKYKCYTTIDKGTLSFRSASNLSRKWSKKHNIKLKFLEVNVL